ISNMKKISKDKADEVIKEYISGCTNFTEIGRKVGISKNTARKIIHESGCYLNNGRFVFNKEQSDKIAQEYLSNENESCASLARKYKVTQKVIDGILKRRNIKPRSLSQLKRKYNLNEHYFDEINTEAKAYFLGLFYGDGCNIETRGTFVIGLQENDRHILETLKKEIETDKPIYVVKPKKDHWQDI